MQYLINTAKPFTGTCESVVLDSGIVAYSGGLPFDQYCQAHGTHYRVVSEDEFLAMLADYEASRVTSPIEETADQFFDALNCLPPRRWGRSADVEHFHVSEPLTGDLVSWHFEWRGHYYTCIDHSSAPIAELIDKLTGTASAL